MGQERDVEGLGDDQSFSERMLTLAIIGAALTDISFRDTGGSPYFPFAPVSPHCVQVDKEDNLEIESKPKTETPTPRPLLQRIRKIFS